MNTKPLPQSLLDLQYFERIVLSREDIIRTAADQLADDISRALVPRNVRREVLIGAKQTIAGIIFLHLDRGIE